MATNLDFNVWTSITIFIHILIFPKLKGGALIVLQKNRMKIWVRISHERQLTDEKANHRRVGRWLSALS